MKFFKAGKMIGQAILSMMKKPATTNYPRVRIKNPEGVRGEIKFYAQRCIGCKLCMKDCPAEAIVIRKIGEKSFEADIDLGKCIFCGQCVDSCLKKALEVTGGFELTQLDKAKLKVNFNAESGKDAK